MPSLSFILSEGIPFYMSCIHTCMYILYRKVRSCTKYMKYDCRSKQFGKYFQIIVLHDKNMWCLTQIWDFDFYWSMFAMCMNFYFAEKECYKTSDVAGRCCDSIICNKFVIYIADKLIKFIGQVEEHFSQVVGMAKLKFVVRQFAEEGFWNRYRSHIGLTVQYKRPVIIFSGNPGTGKTMMADALAGELIL